ncbi:diaminopimelate dehydrogenase [Corynebacterium caspium]|uniref:diaminopimelate dehydrogenase n=1 Tax=Corynebacterium caspium TaxID=234828 RepID=UPI00037CE597|nr:diaminopimelate dehydrogenase [Corynebacterium caspium]WKD59751.1 Meso-diaminopimelate D-dehydrogenase [Corynebacterium caspium DSM 44850]
MNNKIRVGIVGYGNLGKSVENVVSVQPDMELVGVFSRRATLDTTAPVIPVDEVEQYGDKLDVIFLCLGSATDIPAQATRFAAVAPTVDTYDNHRDIWDHRTRMDEVAKEAGTVAIVATGWDPGMFSLNRVYAKAALPEHETNTFWGPGLSQGHSDALRRLDGVVAAVQYTLPNPEALEKARRGEAADIDSKHSHVRQCWVVAPESEQARIEEEIRTMPDYFVGYEVEVNFIDQETFDRDHSGMPHGGHVITTGKAGISNHVVEYSLKLDRNPDFTAAVQVAYGRAAARMAARGEKGAFTVLEVAPALLAPGSLEELVRENV